MSELWELDRIERGGLSNEARAYLAKIKNTPHAKFKIGDRISFWTGHNGDIRAVAKIKAISGADIYVYSDCYWFPIQDDTKRNIKIEE